MPGQGGHVIPLPPVQGPVKVSHLSEGMLLNKVLPFIDSSPAAGRSVSCKILSLGTIPVFLIDYGGDFSQRPRVGCFLGLHIDRLGGSIKHNLGMVQFLLAGRYIENEGRVSESDIRR